MTAPNVNSKLKVYTNPETISDNISLSELLDPFFHLKFWCLCFNIYNNGSPEGILIFKVVYNVILNLIKSGNPRSFPFAIIFVLVEDPKKKLFSCWIVFDFVCGKSSESNSWRAEGNLLLIVNNFKVETRKSTRGKFSLKLFSPFGSTLDCLKKNFYRKIQENLWNWKIASSCLAVFEKVVIF